MKKILFVFIISVLSIWFALGGYTKKVQALAGKEVILRIAIQDPDRFFDPVNFKTVNGPQVQAAIYEGLVRYKMGTFNLEPLLATRWEVSKDGLIWRFFLRRGVQFHHGYGEMNAKDVVFTFERAKDPQFKGLPFSADWAGIKTVEAEDSYTIRMTLTKPDLIFLHRFAGCHGYIVSEKAVREMGSEKFNFKPIGTGPYAFVEWGPSQTILVKHAKYWGGEPKLDRVEYLVIPDRSTQYNAFESGDVDMISVDSPEKFLKYKNDPKVQVQSVEALHNRHLGMNVNHKPFDDIRVRQAISYAIDRNAIVEGLLRGSTTPAKGFFTPSVDHALTDFTGVWQPSYNPKKAKELLAEAGYPNGFETIITCPSSDRVVKPMTVIQEHLKAVGINAKIQSMEVGPFYGSLRKGNWPIWGMIDNFQPYIDSHIEGQFRSTRYPGDNWTAFQDPEVDKWLDQAFNTRDEKVRDELFKKIQKRVIEQAHFYFIDWENIHFAVQKKVKGFLLDPQRRIHIETVYIEN